MALSIYCASIRDSGEPLPMYACVERARDLSAAVDKSFEAEIQAAEEKRMQEVREMDEKAGKMKKARIEIYGKDEDEEE